MKKVAVIQDLSSFGKCSLTAAIPVLSVMGSQAVPLPTAVLSAQTAYPSYYIKDFTDKMHHFMREWESLDVSFDGIHTGFVTGGEQINHIFSFLELFLKQETLLLVDPVMGDDGEVYKMFSGGLLDRMKELVKQANVITPNVTECCLLSGLDYEKLHRHHTEADYLQSIEEAGQHLEQLTGAKVIVTGVHPPVQTGEQERIGNMYIGEGESFYYASAYNRRSYSGTGDLFASVMMGSMMRGQNLDEAVRLAVRFLGEAIAEASREAVPEIEGIPFEKHLGMLL